MERVDEICDPLLLLESVLAAVPERGRGGRPGRLLDLDGGSRAGLDRADADGWAVEATFESVLLRTGGF